MRGGLVRVAIRRRRFDVGDSKYEKQPKHLSGARRGYFYNLYNPSAFANLYSPSA
jgi:hypothetical protein